MRNLFFAIAIGLLVSTSVSNVAAQLDEREGSQPVDKETKEVPEEGSEEGAWGHLAGQIVVSGELPKPQLEEVGGAAEGDLAACLVDGKVPLDDGIVISDQKQLRDVFVLMYLGRGANVPEKFHPSYAELKKEKVSLVMENCRFVPHAFFARAGQMLAIENNDDVGHNCHLTSFGQEHSINLPASRELQITLDGASDKVPGEVRCDIHQWMDGVFLIRDNPYVAISDETGAFRIENIPAGDWQFQFWHKKAGYLKTLEVKDFEPNRRGVIDLKIENEKTLDLGTLTLPTEAFRD